jgi:hypothetical protein
MGRRCLGAARVRAAHRIRALRIRASAEEVAASRWIADPQALLEAIERQQRMPVLPLGNSCSRSGC